MTITTDGAKLPSHSNSSDAHKLAIAMQAIWTLLISAEAVPAMSGTGSSVAWAAAGAISP